MFGMSEEPLVSIIITTYNRPESLQKAIEKCINQSYQRKEILVVDTSGEKYARDIVDQYEEVSYFGTSKELGQIASWNRSVDKVSGDYIQLHDDDDWLKPSKIEQQVEYLKQKEDADVVYCGITSEMGEVLLPESSNRGDVTEQALKQNVERCQTTTMLIDSSKFEEVMPIHEFGCLGDLALQIELCQITRFDFIEKPLVRRILYHDSIGDSLLNRRKRLELIDHYTNLYDEHPEVKRQTLIKVNKMLAEKLLEEKFWSLDAIKAFHNVLKYEEELKIKDLTRLIFSLLGRPGLKFGEILYHKHLSKL